MFNNSFWLQYTFGVFIFNKYVICRESLINEASFAQFEQTEPLKLHKMTSLTHRMYTMYSLIAYFWFTVTYTFFACQMFRFIMQKKTS